MRKNGKNNTQGKAKRCWTLFISSFVISAFTFGGGFVIVPLMRKKYVTKLQWIKEEEMLDITAIAQSSSGAIAVNASILLGYKIAGVLGVVCAVLGTILPPMGIIMLVSLAYDAFRTNEIVAVVLQGMQAGVAAVILDVVVQMIADVGRYKQPLAIAVMVVAFALNYFVKLNVMYIIGGCLVIGLIAIPLTARKAKCIASLSDSQQLTNDAITDSQTTNAPKTDNFVVNQQDVHDLAEAHGDANAQRQAANSLTDNTTNEEDKQ